MAVLWIGSKGLPGEWLGKHLFFLAIHNSIVTLVRANRNKMLARAPLFNTHADRGTNTRANLVAPAAIDMYFDDAFVCL